MRIIVSILFVFILLAACKNKDGVPGNVLPRLKMQSVLWDMMRADQFLSNYLLNKDTSLNKKSETIKLYEQIFHIHHITKEEFKTSLSFYRSHPLILKEIMDSLSNKKIIIPADTTKTKSPLIMDKKIPSGKDTPFLKKEKLPAE
jgi:hypothetical protein